jgi:hypothetical protein
MWTDLEELYAYVGYGKNGWKNQNRGSDQNSPAVMLTASSSTHQSK